MKNHRLMAYADGDNESVGGYHVPQKFVVTWCKSGVVRANLTTPEGIVVPLRDYDSMSATQSGGEKIYADGRSGCGAFAVASATARKLLKGELKRVMGEMDESKRTAEYIRHHSEGQDGGATLPYNFYKFGAIEWLAAAREGLAYIWQGEGHQRRWRWCTPEEARAVSEEPLSEREYCSEMRKLIEQIPCR